MSAIIDFLFRNKYYKEVLSSYKEANGHFCKAFEVWKESCQTVILENYKSKEFVHQNLKQIKQVNIWIQATDRLLKNNYEAIEWLLSERQVPFHLPFHYAEYELVANEEQNIRDLTKMLETYHSLMKTNKEAVGRFLNGNKVSHSYSEIRKIAGAKETIERIGGILEFAYSCKDKYPLAWKQFSNNRDLNDMPIDELQSIKCRSLFVKESFLPLYKSKEKLILMILGETSHQLSSFSNETIAKEEYAIFYLKRSLEDIFPIRQSAVVHIDGDELKRAILDSTKYGKDVRFFDDFTTSDFYRLRSEADKLGIPFDDIVSKVKDNNEAIKAYNNKKSGKSAVYIENYIQASTVNTPLYNFIETYRKEGEDRNKAQIIANNYPLGYKLLYGDWIDLKKCDITFIRNIINAEEAIKKRNAEEVRQEEQRKEAIRKEKEAEENRIKSLSSLKKVDAISIRDLLFRNGIKCFYHFTDKANIESIRRNGGLYSWHYLKSHGIQIPNQGGTPFSEELDKRYGLQDYVRLSFCKSHPMAYRKMKEGANIVVLKISLDVATFRYTMFSDMNATDSLHSQGGDLTALQKIRFAATQREYVRHDDADFKYLQAEVMVKTFIPLQYIENINNINTVVNDDLPF